MSNIIHNNFYILIDLFSILMRRSCKIETIKVNHLRKILKCNMQAMNFQLLNIIRFSFLFNRYGFVHIGRVGSVLLTLSVTVERFFAIVYPLKRLRRTRFLIYTSTVGTIVYNVPRFFEFKTNYVHVVKDDISIQDSNAAWKNENWDVSNSECIIYTSSGDFFFFWWYIMAFSFIWNI